VLHVLPRGFIVDGQEGVKDPLGMSAIRLEIETHIVTASATAVRNLAKCVQAANVKIDELVAALSPRPRRSCRRRSASSAWPSCRHRRRHDRPGALPRRPPFKTAVLPVGGNNVTNDVAIGLKTSLQVAEELKIQHGSCDLSTVRPDEMISVSMLGEAAGRTVSRLEICQIIEARMRETFEMLRAEIRSGRRRHAAGGRRPDRRRGSARRRGGPRPRSPQHAGSRGRPHGRRRADGQHPQPGLQHRHRPAATGAPRASRGRRSRFESAPAGGAVGRVRDALRNLFP
jgi:hypothetical protein